MLLYFKTENNLSYEGLAEFSMIAGNYSELPENTVNLGKYKISALKTSVIYGANASGKSNLFAAMANGVKLITGSTKEIQIGDKLPYFPNKTKSKNFKKPTSYVFGILVDGIHFEYSFSFNESYIIEEKLLEYATQKPIEHFHRKYNNETNNYDYKFSIKHFLGEREKIKEITSNLALYLSVGAQFKLPVSEKIFSWFKAKFVPLISRNSPGDANVAFTLNLLKTNPAMKKLIMELLQKADFLIKDIVVETEGTDSPKPKVTSYHESENEKGEKILIPFDLKEESVGTLRFLAWTGIWLDVLIRGRVLLVDELGNSMHTLLSKHLIELFQDPEVNINNAQLIFTTHDTNMMDAKILRRDQIWIIDRDEAGNSSLFPISDFKIKKGKVLENSYLQGVYGGIPHIINDSNIWDG